MMRSANLHHLNMGGLFLKLKLASLPRQSWGFIYFFRFRYQYHTEVYKNKNAPKRQFLGILGHFYYGGATRI
jgi:hypothetical protein